MYAWTRFPFVRFAFTAIGGILLFEANPALWVNPLPLFLGLCFVYLLSWLVAFPFGQPKFHLLNGCLGLILIAYSFGWITKAQESLTDPNHWRHTVGKVSAFEGRIVSDVLVNERTHRYTLEVWKLVTRKGEVKSNGQMHLYVKRNVASGDSLVNETTLLYGDVIRVLASPSEIPPPTNPEEFNYSAYVARLQIHGQCFVTAEKITWLANQTPNVVIGEAIDLRNYLKAKIIAYVSNPDAQAIALALLVGVKDFLSEDLQTAYASAGAMHVLAVSGLHVGILYLLLLFFLKPLEKLKRGNILIAVLSISVIWIYTFVTGMSPSVLRAATMFSVFATSKAMDRDSNIYNSLGISAFILLLYDPNLLFSVGFQLSFLAVTGIVYLQPRIYHLLYVRNRYLDKVWMITAVSIAAQISTLPMTIYYFHQFPTYFFLSNLVVIPGATIIMMAGILMLLVGSFFDGLGFLIGALLNGIIMLMNYLVSFVEQIPGSLITWLYFNDFQVWLVYGIIVLILMGFYFKSSFYLNASVLGIALFFWSGMQQQWSQIHREEMIIYDIAGTTAIDLVKGSDASLFVDETHGVNHELLRFQIDPYRRANGLEAYDVGLQEFQSLTSVEGRLKFANLSGTRVLVLDSLLAGFEIKQRISTQILVVNNQSIKSIDWLTKNFQFDYLIVGSDNSWYYTDWLQKELAVRNIASHSLLKQGSWRKNLTDL